MTTSFFRVRIFAAPLTFLSLVYSAHAAALPDVYLHGERPGSAKPAAISPGAPLELHFARDEYALVMAILKPGSQSGSISPIENATLKLKGDGAIAPIELVVSTLGVQRFAKSSFGHQPGGEVPDIVIPNAVAAAKDFHLPKPNVPARPHALFELHPLPATRPGKYTGELAFSSGGQDYAIPVSLIVHATTLPKKFRLKTSFGFSPWDSLKRHYGGWADEELALERKYLALATENRVDLHKIYITMPDKPGDPLADGGAESFVSLWQEVSNGTLGTHGFAWSTTDLPVPENEKRQPSEAYWRALDAAVVAHRLEASSFVYFWDEPKTEELVWIAASLKKIRPWAPHLRFLLTAQYRGALAGLIDIWCPNITQWKQPDYPSPGAYAQLKREKNEDLWLYSSCNAHGCTDPTNDLKDTHTADLVTDRPPVYSRGYAWTAFMEGATGMLYYNTIEAYGHGDAAPWTDPFLFGGYGEGNLFYPCTPTACGATAGQSPLASFRLKTLRDGLEDAELMAMARDRGLPVEQWAREAYRGPRGLPASTADFEKVKIRVLTALDSGT